MLLISRFTEDPTRSQMTTKALLWKVPGEGKSKISTQVGLLWGKSAAGDKVQEAVHTEPLAVWGDKEGRSWWPGYQAITSSASEHATSSNARSFLCLRKTRAGKSHSVTCSCLALGGVQLPQHTCRTIPASEQQRPNYGPLSTTSEVRGPPQGHRWLPV